MKRIYLADSDGHPKAILEYNVARSLINNFDLFASLLSGEYESLKFPHQSVLSHNSFGLIINTTDTMRYGELNFSQGNENALRRSGI